MGKRRPVCAERAGHKLACAALHGGCRQRSAITVAYCCHTLHARRCQVSMQKQHCSSAQLIRAGAYIAQRSMCQHMDRLKTSTTSSQVLRMLCHHDVAAPQGSATSKHAYRLGPQVHSTCVVLNAQTEST